MYDDLSTDYDRFVDWPGRLAAELPFIERQLQAAGARRVLDAACGTGMHALALARRGHEVVGADVSAGMIERARANAQHDGANATFEVAGFGELGSRLGNGFDALLCLGNSLPHLLTPAELEAALTDFAACLRPEGLLLIQNRNFDAVLARRERWMDPQSRREGETDWLFLRFYDFEPDGLLTFNLVTLRREGVDPWHQQRAATRLWPLRQQDLLATLAETGFGQRDCYGDMAGAAFHPDSSPNLVVTARRVTQDTTPRPRLGGRGQAAPTPTATPTPPSSLTPVIVHGPGDVQRIAPADAKTLVDDGSAVLIDTRAVVTVTGDPKEGRFS